MYGYALDTTITNMEKKTEPVPKLLRHDRYSNPTAEPTTHRGSKIAFPTPRNSTSIFQVIRALYIGS
jgi:hypothetical protein